MNRRTILNSLAAVLVAVAVTISGTAFAGSDDSGKTVSSDDFLANPIENLAKTMVPIPGKNYCVCKYEVTQALWEAVMGGNPSEFKGADLPVENVSWNDCQEFIKRLNAQPKVKKSGIVYRLPTEDEWEYACRAGSKGKYGVLADGTEGKLDEMGWYRGNSGDKTHPVGQKKPNAFGLYDMHGNVQELTLSCARCGGGWNYPAGGCGSIDRGWVSGWDHCGDLGLRLVSDKVAKEEKSEAALPSIPVLSEKDFTPDFVQKCKARAEAGDAEGQALYGRALLNGWGVEKNETLGVEWSRKSADSGNAIGQCNLGWCYFFGEGVAKDASKAVEWYRKSAEQGDARAQWNLGWCYENGRGVEKDATKAVEWYRKSAEQGNAKAQYNLGCCYYKGEGVAKDAMKAVEWYRKSAEQGDAVAQLFLGLCYGIGEGVAKDAMKAVEWLRKSAEQGNAKAQYNLGLCYGFGEGVAKDAMKAVEWYRKSAEQGEASAQYSLGLCYMKGQGVSKDEGMAKSWLEKAAAQGLKEAIEKLEELETSVRVISSLATNMVPIPGKNYSVCKYEATQALWEAVMGNNPSRFEGADLPVEKVSWDDCKEFLEKLNAMPEVVKSGVVYRLPTAEEWEYACRAGSTGKYGLLADGKEGTLDEMGWYLQNSDGKTHPVGQKKPNAFGLYDMHGNVWEWTATIADGFFRVRCGGSWYNFGAGDCGADSRRRDDPYYPDDRSPYLGFRLASVSAAQAAAAEREAEAARQEALSSLPTNMVPIPGKYYSVCKYEVTQALWEAVMGENPSRFEGADLPVEEVSWDDCKEFLKKLNAMPEVVKSGVVYRFPTADEWEYACRAGSTGKYGLLADGKEGTLDEMGWYGDNSGGKTHPVGQKKANAFGLYDMHGNVWEWTSTAADGVNRVYCGGSWFNYFAGDCEADSRSRGDPGIRLNFLGIRLASGRAAKEGE